jgi:acyl-CoA synthetase (AMP-forming)/AMP-acid ligase II
VAAARWTVCDALAGRDDARIGLAVADPLGMATAFLAALAAGATVVPLEPAASPVELAVDVASFGLTAIVSDRVTGGHRDAAGLLRARHDLWLTPAGRVAPARARGHARDGDAGASIIMRSSGTTGPRKLIALREAQLLHNARGVVAHHQLTPYDRGYSPLPCSHINALVVGVLSTLVSGGSLVLDERFSRTSFWERARSHDVTWVNLVPAIITILAASPPPDPRVRRRVRFARSASAPLARSVLERFEERCGISVLETYGMTEAAGQITANPIEAAQRRPGSVGKPVGIDVRVVDDGGRPCAAGATGHVEIRGPGVTATGWLHTGDLGRFDGDGYLWLSGRTGDVINRGGEKVFPGDVENVLLTDPRVTAAAVVARPHPVLGEEPVAFVIAEVPRGDRARLAGELACRCRSHLSRFKQPAQITVASALPAGPTGKVRRSVLRRVAAGECLEDMA